MTVEAYQPKYHYINTTFTSADVSLNLADAKVLEIYGNAGQLLADPDNIIKQENYTVFLIYLKYINHPHQILLYNHQPNI